MFDNLSKLFRRKHEFDKTTQDVLDSWKQTAEEIERIKRVKDDPAWQDIERKTKTELTILIQGMITDSKDYRAGRISSLIQVLSAMNTKTLQKNLDDQVADFVAKIGDE